MKICMSSKISERITNQISKDPWARYITCLLKSMGLKSILMDFWRNQVLTILLSHGFLEIFEKYMSPKIENIFQSHGSHGFHGFLEIYPKGFGLCPKQTKKAKSYSKFLNGKRKIIPHDVWVQSGTSLSVKFLVP